MRRSNIGLPKDLEHAFDDFSELEEAGLLHDGRILEDLERLAIEWMLHCHGGHRAKSAASLGMSLRTLTMRRKKWKEEKNP